jgi:hypothetical protein
MANAKRTSTKQSKSKEVISMSTTEMHEPQEMPDDIAQASSMSAPTENLPNDAVETDGGGQSAPSEPPPDEADDAFGAAAVWHKNKKITALWSKAENRNSWVGVEGLGWKKLADNSDSAVVALTMLSAHAKQMNLKANLREDGNRIKEMYVW